MTIRRITKILVANRGEIALRVQRASQELGISTLSIASEADKDSLYARLAQELVVIGSAAPQDSYLAVDKIISTALQHGCDAVHPGYGFLAENADFAAKVQAAGLIFIGPEPEAIRIMGSKTEARARVTARGVPCTPGSAAGLDDAALLQEAERIGWPVLIKAVGGGGGRGMRVAASKSELKDLLPRARAESKKNFASDDVYLEKFLERPRHVEVQVFGDTNGNVVHLGTRDCSTQRRHQKLIEEAPAPDLAPAVREAIHNAAVEAARSVAYTNAGTVEFLVDGDRFYFLEMNTRIQVEHPVTEVVTGIDLVQLQLKVAMGEPIPFAQQEVQLNGHAIEFRIYAEDYAAGFAPVVGRIKRIKRAQFPFVREDIGCEAGDQITPYYDAMLSKLIVFGTDRADALEKSREAFAHYKVEGIKTSVDYLRWLTYNEVFARGPLDINYVEREFGPSTVKAVRATCINDPFHRAVTDAVSGGGAELKNLYNYKSSKFGHNYVIEIIHRRDGFFLARPINENGKRARNKDCRMSNGMSTVMRAIINDVIEKTPPRELFGE